MNNEFIKKVLKESWQLLFIIPILFIIGFIILIMYDLIKGMFYFNELTGEYICTISWEFLLNNPIHNMKEGGIFPALFGTFLVTIITTLVATPLGICTAIFLNEYTKSNFFITLIRVSIRNLAGVPSIVYGLFGLFLFVDLFGLGTSILSSGLTLGLLTLPWIITASEEALKTVPQSYREGSLALGATKWQSIYSNVLPSAIPGMITGIVLGIARAAGETAPILFTGVAYSMPVLPDSIFDQFMALPYHLFILVTQHEGGESIRHMAYGTAISLLLLVACMSLFAILIRSYIRKKQRGI